MKQDAVVGWALARLGQGAGKVKLDARGPLEDVAQRFGLDALSREVMALCWAAEKSLAVARVAREAAGASARSLTVEVMREALGQSLDAALAASASLRRHALVTLDTAGPAQATSELRLSLGLSARLDGAPIDLDGFAPGVRAVRAPIDGSWLERFPASAKIAELIKDRIASVEPLLATIDGCARRDGIALALGASKRFSRGLLLVDGEVLAGLAGRWELLSALRREADLEAMAIVVCQSSALGESWRALTAPPPAQSPRPPLILLVDAARTREVTLVEGLRHQPLSLNAPTEKVAEAAQKEDPYELIRRQAQRDAERALGVWKPSAEDLKSLQVNRPKLTASEETKPVKAEPVKAEPVKAEPVKAEPAKVEAAKAEAPKIEPPQKAEAAPPSTDDKSKKPKRSRKAMEHFGPDPGDEAAAPRAPVAAPVTPSPTSSVTAPQTSSEAAAPADATLNSSAPYLPLSEKPTAEEVAMVARTSPNPLQRVEMLNALKGAKTQPVVQALRDNVKSEHPAVRAAAEEGMASLFGPNWNRTRVVAKPVQPPGSDDKNRPW